MAAFECLSGFVTGVGPVLTDMTGNGGDLPRIRNTPGRVYLMNLWTDVVQPGQISIRSAKFHDNVSPLLFQSAGAGELAMPFAARQRVYSGDVFRGLMSGSALPGAIDSGTICLYYETLPGLDQNLITLEEYQRRFANYKTLNLIHTPSMIGGYGGATSLAASAVTLKGNTEYAVCGFDTNAFIVGTFTFQGPDTSGLRIPMPYAQGDANIYHQWFLRLAEQYPDEAMIPVIHSQNMPATILESVHSSVLVPAGPVTLILAELN